MAVAAPRVRAPAPSVAAPERAERRRAVAERGRVRPKPKLARGVAWIAIVGALLAGIVALNVAVLQLRMDRGKIQSDIVTIRAENAKIQAEISGAASVSKVEGAARRLGLVASLDTSYAKVGGGSTP